MAAWPSGAQLLSTEDFKNTIATGSARALPHRWVGLDGASSGWTRGRSPLAGVAGGGMRSRGVLESHLLLGEQDIFMAGFRFLWENRTTFSREFLEFGRKRSAGMSRLPHHTQAASLWPINRGKLVHELGFFVCEDGCGKTCSVSVLLCMLMQRVCVNTPVSVTCFLLFVTATAFPSMKFNVL